MHLIVVLHTGSLGRLSAGFLARCLLTVLHVCRGSQLIFQLCIRMTEDGTSTELLGEIKPKGFCAAATSGIKFSKFAMREETDKLGRQVESIIKARC